MTEVPTSNNPPPASSASAKTETAVNPARRQLWVFGYGSLMWEPGFAVHCKLPARLNGYHRSYNMYSTRNRGTPDVPGILLSLAPGSACTGMVMHVVPGREQEALDYLKEREGVGRAHRQVRMPVFVQDNGRSRIIHAHAFLPIHSYANYIHGIPTPRLAELIAQAEGSVGSSLEYLTRLMTVLEDLGVSEPALEKLLNEARTRMS